ncbi:penicillin-binding protein 2 [Rhodobacterales bacterium 52_120_T64]|nr:penicillin-binding protein 2 [Rhodobacterales bacterium 52_120_T64]
MMQPTRTSRMRQRRITRRGLLWMGMQMGVIGVLGWRMRQLQIDQSDQFRLLAEENRINIRLLAPNRGLIFDRNGAPIAINDQNYRIVMIREQAGNANEVLDRLGELITLSPERRARIEKDMRQRSAFVPVTVSEHLTWQEFALVSSNAPALPGILPEVGLTRNYPFGQAYAHMVGYVGPVSESDLARMDDPDPLFQIPRYPIGKTGVERNAEETLRGSAGTSRIEVNSIGRIMRELGRDDGIVGKDIQLTLDTGLQEYAMERMGDQSASAIVMDVRNGDIVAMASAPSFDPNKFVRGISTEDWGGLRDNEYRPLSNKSVSGAYPPGSTFKMVVALAAREADVIKPEETVYCPGYYELGGRRFHCWKRGGHGKVDMVNSLKQSCDVYYYEVAKRVGIEAIALKAKQLGLGEKYDIPLPAISRGLVPNKAYKQRVFDQGWLQGDTLNAGIGQGFVLTSPLQLAVMTSRIASGKTIIPRLIKSISGVPQVGVAPEVLDIQTVDIEKVRRGMFAVVNERRGTAYASRIDDNDMVMAGKTGTSQVRQITTEERAAGVTKNEDLPWKRRDHALFVGYAPFDNPRYAVTVIVEHGGGGSSVAAPIARDIMMRALYEGEPPLSAYPAAERNRIRGERERAREAARTDTNATTSSEGN